jgi:hypothetical protein
MLLPRIAAEADEESGDIALAFLITLDRPLGGEHA